MNTKIADRLQSALETIDKVARSVNRSPNSIQLLAVSKTKPIEMVEQAWLAGQRAFGENYVQEGLQKIEACQHLNDIEWHLIGPLQSNKCKPVAAHFDWVQSVDRQKIAQRLNDHRPEQLAPLNVCLQVNISGEDSKSGMQLAEVLPLAEIIHTSMPRLCLRGLMAIPSNTEDESHLGAEFQQLQQLFSQLQQSYDKVDTLSMGMSGDMALAIANGSTMVRIGTAIFGTRSPKQ